MAKPGKCAESGFPSPEDFDKACFGGGGGGGGGAGGARAEAFLQAGYQNVP